MNAFVDALSRNWDLIVTVFMWAVSLLLGLVLVSKLFKALSMEFESTDVLPLALSALWFVGILIIGPHDVSTFLKSIL